MSDGGRGHFEGGRWVPEKVVVRLLQYGIAEDSVAASPQEAWQAAERHTASGEGYPEFIEIDGRRVYLGLHARNHGGIAESMRVLRDEYGVDTSRRDR
jgi:hypothetical protein